MQTSESIGSRRSANTVRARGDVGPGAEPCRDPDIIEGYLRDASGQVGVASALFRPESEADVGCILARAHRERVALTLVAGQTSTTGSSVPGGGWVLSTERLNRLGKVDADDLAARCEAGIMLGEFQDLLAEMDLVYPPDPTSRYECTLGGSVACNASGPRSHRYGATRRWIRGLRVVLACGEVVQIRRGEWVAGRGEHFEIVHGGDPERCAFQSNGAQSNGAQSTPAEGEPLISRIPVPGFSLPAGIKNAAGYYGGSEVDLIDLFIGSEGTLGAVTEVEVELLPNVAGWLSMFAFFPDESSALDLIELARDRSSPGSITRPDCIEWFDKASLRLIAQALPEFEIPARAELALFIEQSFLEPSSTEQGRSDPDALRASDLDRHWLELLERCGALVELPGGVRVAQTAGQHEELRRVRHAVPSGVNERAARNGMPKLGTDLSVADDQLRAVIELYHRAAEQPLQLLGESALRELLTELGCGIAADQPVTRQELRDAGLPESLEAVTFGHVADNHLHVNFLPRDSAGLALARSVYAHLTRVVIEMGGSPSAEHGIGKVKRAALRQRVGDSGIAEMLAVKRALDPHGCLGRGNLFEEADVVP